MCHGFPSIQMSTLKCPAYSIDYIKYHFPFCVFRDLRAQLELAVAEVMELAQEPDTPIDSDYMSDSESVTTVQCNGKLASSVRKHLAFCIQNLMEHGLMPVSYFHFMRLKQIV